jgi:hypothetical protein
MNHHHHRNRKLFYHHWISNLLSSNSIFLSITNLYLSFFRRKLPSNESIISDSIFEQEEFECRQNDFTEYLTTLNEIRQYREDDYHNRSKEKARQLEEYTDLQAKIDQIRRCIHEPRELFRQRFLEIERQRLEELAMQQQKLLEQEKAKAVAALIEPTKKKTTSPGKKKKK